MKYELGGKIMSKFIRLSAKTYSCLIDDSSEDKTAKGKQSVSSKENLNMKIIKAVQKQLNLITN